MKRFEKLTWLIPMVLAFVAHVSVLKNGFVNYDDTIQILENLPRLTFFHQVWHYPQYIHETSVYYRPTIWIAFMLARFLSGYEPWGYHLVQVLLHAMNSGLVYWLALRFFKGQKNQVLGALIAAAIFAVHPVHIEVVAWISAMVETLFTFFFLLALIFHIQSRDSPKRKTLAILAMLSFFLALISKETAMAFLILVPLYDVIFIKPTGRLWKNLVPLYFFYTLVFPLYVPLRLANVSYNLSSHISVSPMESLFRLVAAFGYYFQKSIWPISFNPHTSTLPTTTIFLCISAFFLILIGFLCVYTFRFSRILFFHILFYLFCLAPSLLISLTRLSGLPVAERYLYLPLYGFSFIFAWGVIHVENVLKPVSSRKIIAISKISFVSIIIITGVLCSYARGSTWRNDESFWFHIAKMNSQSYIPWVNLATFEISNNNCAQASVYLDKAARRHKGAEHGKIWARFYYLRSICTYVMGEKDEAIDLAKKSIQIFPQPEGYFNLGMIYFKESNANPNENLPLAKEAFENALGKDKTGSEYAYHLGLTLETMGDMSQARHYYEYCVALKQDNKWTRMAREKLQQIMMIEHD